MLDSTTKRCTKCKREYPATNEYFYSRTRRNQLESVCKSCCRVIAKTNRDNPKGRVYECLPEGFRRCSKCRQLKHATLENFRSQSDCVGGLHSICRECHRGQSKEYSETPIGQANAKRNRRLPKRQEYNRQYFKSDRYQQNKHRYRDAGRVALVRRRARKLSLPNDFTAANWRTALEYFCGRCAVCNRPPGLWHTLAMDHWIPLSNPNCPGTVITNIVPLCHGDGGCNNSKHTKDAGQWLTDTFGKRKARVILERIETYFKSAELRD